ncbi:CHAT domain-containing protein [bacterium]|nr:CHAT domain-containing protein [bacterium]
MSQSQTIELACPHCHHEFTAELWTVVNVDTEPHLKTELVEETLNFLTCLECNEKFFISIALVYHESATERVICYVPEDLFREEQREGVVRALLLALLEEFEMEAIPDYIRDPLLVLNFDALIAIVRGEQSVDVLTMLISDFDKLIATVRIERLLHAFSALSALESPEQLPSLFATHPILLTAGAVSYIYQMVETLEQQGQIEDSEWFRGLAHRLLYGATQDLLKAGSQRKASERSAEVIKVLTTHPILRTSEGITKLRQLGEASQQHGEEDIEDFCSEVADILETIIDIPFSNVALLKLVEAGSLEEISQVLKSYPMLYTLEAVVKIRQVANIAQKHGKRVCLPVADKIELTLVEEGIPPQTNPLFQLAEQVIDGSVTQEESLMQVQNPNFLSSLSKWGIMAVVRFVLIDIKNKANNTHARVLAELNFTATQAHKEIRAEIKAVCGVALLSCIPKQPRYMQKRVQVCRAILNLINRDDDFGLDTMGALANEYIQSLNGDSIENDEEFSLWADTMGELANAYNQNPHGDHAENLERAIECYKRAMEIYTREAFPKKWAITQSNLGAAYLNRIKGNRTENLKLAVDHFQASLDVLNQDTFPGNWAKSQMNLGIAYRWFARIRSENLAKYAENLEIAISYHQTALQVYTPIDYPEDWAMVQQNLAAAYMDRLEGNQAKNLEFAISCCQAALEVYTQESYPESWAAMQQNLGEVYRYRIEGNRAENLEEAVRYFTAAINMYQRLGFQDSVCRSSSNKGHLHYDEGQWEEAYFAYHDAIEALSRVRTEAITEQERTRLIRENIRAFERLVICCMITRRFGEAAEYAERGKARNLIDLLTRRDLRPLNAPEDIQHEYERLLFRARALENEMRQSGESISGERGFQRPIEQVRTELISTQEDIESVVARIREFDPDYLPVAKPLSFTDMQRLASEFSTCIVQLRVTETGTYAFLITGSPTPGPSQEGSPEEETLSDSNVISIPAFTSERLSELLIKWEGEDEARVPVDGWLLRYYNYRNNFYSLKTRQAWYDCLDETVRTLSQELFAPVYQRLKELDVQRLVLVPTRGLSLLPLHAMYYDVGRIGNSLYRRRYLIDDFEITYAPSCAILQRCLARDEEGRTKERLSAVANPRGDLIFSDWESAELEGMFPDSRRRVLWHEQAQWDAVLEEMPRGNFIHFSCHGEFNLNEPLESALLLAGKESLTLGEIFERFDASQSYLVSLSACETGITENFRDVTDEYVGLPAGFLFARANAVVASLWAVNDFSTALLMTRFYENILRRDMGRAAGLREAQIWLRGLSKEKAVELLQEKETELRTAERRVEVTALAKQRERIQQRFDEESHPFAHPYWWAAFQCVGAF